MLVKNNFIIVEDSCIGLKNVINVQMENHKLHYTGMIGTLFHQEGIYILQMFYGPGLQYSKIQPHLECQSPVHQVRYSFQQGISLVAKRNVEEKL